MKMVKVWKLALQSWQQQGISHFHLFLCVVKVVKTTGKTISYNKRKSIFTVLTYPYFLVKMSKASNSNTYSDSFSRFHRFHHIRIIFSSDCDML